MNKISIVVGTIMATTWLLIGLLNNYPEKNPKYYLADNYGKIYVGSKLKSEIAGKTPEYNQKNLLKDLHNNRTNEYFKNSDKLSSLIQLLAAMTIIGLLILFYNPKSLELPIISINIPDTLLYISVSIGLVYLWLQFGLRLNSGVDSRLALHRMTGLIEHDDGLRVAYNYSNINIYVDNSAIDTWCNYYYNIFGDGDPNPFHKILGFFGLYGIYGVFIGFIHSTSLALISEFYGKKKHGLIYILYFFALLMFIVSGSGFIIKFIHGAYFISWVWIVVVLTLFLWDKKLTLLPH